MWPPTTEHQPHIPEPTERVDHTEEGSPDAENSNDVPLRIGEEWERHPARHEGFRLVAVAHRDRDGARADRHDLGVRLPHLREVVATGQSAVIAGKQKKGGSVKKLSQRDRLSGRLLDCQMRDGRSHGREGIWPVGGSVRFNRGPRDCLPIRMAYAPIFRDRSAPPSVVRDRDYGRVFA